MRTVDVVVVGAGPAGAAAATTLARAGVDTLVVDKATFPRDKICGDGLTTGALRLLDGLGLELDGMASWQEVEDCWIRSPTGVSRRFPMPRGQGAFAAVVPRTELDAAVIDLARKAGAEVLEGHGVVGAHEDGDGIEVDVAGLGVVRARFAVAADGMWSPMRKHLGLAQPGYRGEWHAFRQYASNVSAEAARDLFVLFEPDLLPGYYWSFPLPDGRANIGFGIQRGGKVEVGDMKAVWADLLSRTHIAELLGPDAVLDGTVKAWPIPARIDDISTSSARTMFVGDAAAACDPLTGEGIGQALLTGIRAAEAIIGGSRTGARPVAAATVTDGYDSAVRRDLVADHKMSMLLVRALQHRKGARTAVRVAGLTPWTRRNFARWLFEDYPRAVIVTPRRWHRKLFTGPGAFRTH